eukprot:g7566.t1
MEFLRKLDKDSVHAELERFQGVGKKTSAIINLFDCNNPDMAVDTHVFRFALQLGWAPSEKQRARHNKEWLLIGAGTFGTCMDSLMGTSCEFLMIVCMRKV